MEGRWRALVRHGLVGTGLLAAAADPAAADCDHNSEHSIGLVFGATFTPKLSVMGGLEVRRCVSNGGEVMARLEIASGGPPRVIAGARAYPFTTEANWDELDREQFGIEAGLLVDFRARFAAHLAASYGYKTGYLAGQAAIPFSDANSSRIGFTIGLAPWHEEESDIAVGRPLIVEGAIVRPRVAGSPLQLAAAEERAARDHFASSAQFEYSSVWTFLRLAAELAAVGAPTRLIAAALDAADDEVRHAELCAAVARVTLTPLAHAAAQPRFTQRTPSALAQLAVEAWLEGCLNEGAAAEEARIAATETTDAARASMLATIARDEQGHAELSWQVLAWLFEVAPHLASSTIAAAPTYSGGEASADDPALARHGVPSSRVSRHARAFAARVARERFSQMEV